MYDIKLIATDMDGTLLNHDQQISDANKRALQRAHKQGIIIAVCSGRAPEDISRIMAPLGIDCWVSGVNGARLMDKPFGSIIKEYTFEPKVGLAILDVCLQNGLAIGGYCGAKQMMIPHPKMERWQEIWEHQSQVRGTELVSGEKESRAMIAAGQLNKLLAISPGQPEKLKRASKQLAAMAEVDVTSSWEDNIELMPHGVHKGRSIEEIARRAGVDRKNVMAFGDQMNDAEMLAWAGVSVAMGNALETLQKQCTLVTDTAQNDGVGKALTRYVLGEEA